MRWISTIAFVVALAASSNAAATPTMWEPAKPGYRFTFPADYGSHERSRDEWWYYTGNLSDTNGHRFGFEETIFRFGVQSAIAGASPWDIDDLYFAHVAVTVVDDNRFAFTERIGRAALHHAGATTGDEHAWVGDWSVRRRSSGAHDLLAAAPDFGYSLTLVPVTPAVINGAAGVSRKGACGSCASHYYSFTDLRASGTLRVGTTTRDVTGLGWNDHEWGSDELAAGVVGWDWFSMQLDDGTQIMLYRLRTSDGTTVPQSSGTLVLHGGSSRHLPLSDFSIAATGHWKSPHENATYPSGWRVRLSREEADLAVTPLVRDQELHASGPFGASYWEGACAVKGTLRGRRVHGYGYTELTGYAPGGLGPRGE